MNDYVFNTSKKPLNVTGTVVVPGASDYFIAASLFVRINYWEQVN